MTRSRTRSLLIASVVWVVLIGAGAYVTYPAIGQLAASIEPNPFWSVATTGNESAPFRVELKTISWLAWCLGPVALLWVASFLLTRRPPRHAA